MYYDYFGLNQPPFRITPDTNLFFPGANRGAILEALIYAVGNGEGIVKVVGEVGSGKTMLCRMLEQELPERIELVYLANPSLAPENILHVIAFELKLPVSASTPRLEVMHALQDFLLARHAENRQVVVFVEEAQGMPIATLEEIRLLSNLETRQSKLLQIVLFGQPELDVKLAQPEIRQLKERITYSFQLPPFNPNDIRDYLNSRVRACGCRAAELFSPGAVQAIAQYSHGLVRRINIIADKSLLAAYADSTIQVSKVHVAKAAKDSEFTTGRRRWWLPASVAAAVVAVALVMFWWQGRAIPEMPVAVESSSDITAPKPASKALEPDSIPPPTQSAIVPEPQAQVPVFQLEETVTTAAPAEPSPLVADPGAAADSPPVAPPEAPEVGKAAPSAQVKMPVPVTGEPAPVPGEASSRLYDLTPLFHLQDGADSSLSATEMALLRQQVTARPPEESPAAAAGTIDPPCELCWGIVYRPLVEPESL